MSMCKIHQWQAFENHRQGAPLSWDAADLLIGNLGFKSPKDSALAIGFEADARSEGNVNLREQALNLSLPV